MTRDRISGILLLVIGGTIGWFSRGYPELEEGYPGPGLFPGIIGLALAVVGVYLLLKGQKTHRSPQEAGHAQLRSLLVLVACIAGVPPVVEQIGLLPVLAGVVVVVGLLARIRLYHIALTSAIATGLIYVIFSLLLGVPV